MRKIPQLIPFLAYKTPDYTKLIWLYEANTGADLSASNKFFLLMQAPSSRGI